MSYKLAVKCNFELFKINVTSEALNSEDAEVHL